MRHNDLGGTAVQAENHVLLALHEAARITRNLGWRYDADVGAILREIERAADAHKEKAQAAPSSPPPASSQTLADVLTFHRQRTELLVEAARGVVVAWTEDYLGDDGIEHADVSPAMRERVAALRAAVERVDSYGVLSTCGGCGNQWRRHRHEQCPDGGGSFKPMPRAS